MVQTTFKYDNGDKVRDRITNFTGIIVAQTNWHYGCKRYLVQPQELHEGKPIDSISFDEDQLDLVEVEAVAPSVKETGGPAPEPRRPPDAVLRMARENR